ncbi:hypothetical protein [Butyrivibrio fibrisolvens]|uniref:hypothetical protein n=1 Tax=Butyrivibrio fibrisolvens TaxID=831 RepID=UPI0003B40DE1|nr:hypothetical protein [Butyrivibrio fibrisolvens]
MTTPKKFICILGIILTVIIIYRLIPKDLRTTGKIYIYATSNGLEVDKIEYRYQSEYSEDLDDICIRINNFYKYSKEERMAYAWGLYSTVLNEQYYSLEIYSANEEYNYKGLSKAEIEEDKEEEKQIKIAEEKAKEERLIQEYSSYEIPIVGMREEGLDYTQIGIHSSMEKCLDFDILNKVHKHRKYYWRNIGEYVFISVTVRYRKHNSNRVDDYEDYPDDNGYVYSVTYEKKENQLRVMIIGPKRYLTQLILMTFCDEVRKNMDSNEKRVWGIHTKNA